MVELSPCPECGWPTVGSSGSDTNPNGPILLRWLAVRPEQAVVEILRSGEAVD